MVLKQTVAKLFVRKNTTLGITNSLRCLLSSTPSSDLSNETRVSAPGDDLNRPTIGRTVVEQEFLYLQQPDMPENPRVLKISVLGVPNAGKSTLVNRLMNRRISAVSRKLNTTRNRLTAVLTDGDAQLIFMDTPGILTFKKQKKFNVDRQFIIDPHSSLWESDIAIVVHDVGDEYSRNRIDSELIKCLFAHPEKESILVLNKTDLVKKKKVLLDLVVDLTGGVLNGQQKFMRREQTQLEYLRRHSLRNYDYERLFARTAEKMGMTLELEEGGPGFKRKKEIAGLLEELKTCEEYLFKNVEQSGTALIDPSKRITLEKLKGESLPAKLNPSNAPSNKELKLVDSIVSSTNPPDSSSISPPIRRIEDISPEDFKRDLLQTTDWNLYYKKLNALSLLVREKTYWPYFNQVFMVSAKTDDGIDELKRYLFARAKPGPWLFSRNLMTDQMPKDIAEMCVREKMLENMDGEVPYQVGIEVTDWYVDESDCIRAVINIIPGDQKANFVRHVSMLLKDSGRLIRLIRDQACQELMNTFQCEVRLKLIVQDIRR